jgi:hypothetical protein
MLATRNRVYLRRINKTVISIYLSVDDDADDAAIQNCAVAVHGKDCEWEGDRSPLS